MCFSTSLSNIAGEVERGLPAQGVQGMVSWRGPMLNGMAISVTVADGNAAGMRVTVAAIVTCKIGGHVVGPIGIMMMAI